MLVGFDRSSLKKVETRVKDTQGNVVIEKHDGATGKFVASSTSASSSGVFMVVDTSPDEQLHCVVTGLYIGSQDAATNVSGLKEAHVTHILNCAKGLVIQPPAGITHKNLDLLDIPEQDLSKTFDIASDFIRLGIIAGGVLVHCNAGVSRSASIVLAFLMQHHSMSLPAALELLKKARPAVQPNAGFMAQLRRLEQRIQKSESSTKQSSVVASASLATAVTVSAPVPTASATTSASLESGASSKATG